MKETDPDNLRAPALRLLADLVSEDSRVRLDLFGDQVHNLLPVAVADGDHRQAMRRAADRIGSDEPFTAIPTALEAAGRGWDDAAQRHVILLSDGRLDVSDDPGANESATARLRDEVIPSLLESDVRVHTVALSREADADMLGEIADRTGGVAISARGSADLQRAFLELFEATAPRTGLPLTDNRVKVDDSVRELTLVIFRKPGADPTRVVVPDGGKVDADRAAEMGDWRWDDSAGRDLVTVSGPAAGEWRIQAREDPDNRALVITDLDLAMSDIPGRVHPGEVIEGHLQLTNRGQPLIEPRLVDEARMTIRAVGPSGDAGPPIPLNDRGEGDDRAGQDGYYDFRLRLTDHAGNHALVGRIEGPTFERVIRRKVAVSPTRPFEVRLVAGEEGSDENPAALVVEQDPGIVDPEATRLVAEIRCPPGEPNRTDVALQEPLSRIALPSRISADCRVTGELSGRSREDREIGLPFELKVPASPARATASLPPDTALKEPSWQSDEPADTRGDRQPVDISEYRDAVMLGLAGLLLLALLTIALAMWTARTRQRLIQRARS